MQYRAIVGLVALAIGGVAQASTLENGIDAVGFYGQIVGTPSSVSASDSSGSASASGGNTNGGIGVFLTGTNRDLWYTHLGFDYAFGAPINGGTISVPGYGAASGSANVSGHSMAFNLRFGKLFAIDSNMALGPYLAYQYAQFQMGLDGNTVKYGNNALGGGLYLATVMSPQLTLSGHVGYLAGVNASASGDAYSIANPPSSDVLQVGAKVDYRFESKWSAFVGVNYDRYDANSSYTPDALTASATINDVRGMFGMAYHY